MADTAVAITAGTGTNIDTRTEGTNGNHRQVVVLGDPATNAGVAPVDAVKGLTVDPSGVTSPVSAASLPLPTGAATAAKQPALGTAGAASTDVITVQGIASGTAQPVSIATAPALVAGSAIIGKVTTDQTTHGTTDLVAADITKLAGTATDVNSGVKSAGTLRVVLATDQPALTNKLLVTPDSVALPANQSVNVSQINAVTPLMGNGVTGTGSQRVTIASDNTVLPGVGAGATASAPPANASYVGLIAKTANPSAASDGNLVGGLADKLGRQIVNLGAVRDLRGKQTTTIAASTAETTIVTAVASTFLDLVALVVSNTSATAARLDIRDTTAGTVLFSLYVPAGDTRGFTLTGSSIPQTTVNTSWTAQSSASVTDLRILAIFEKNI